jgi:RimJ/RimL family protein N-acetyltransferase
MSSDPIPWQLHQEWFAARVNSPSCLFYIAANSNVAQIGQIRYDITGSNAVVSMSLAKEARGRGYGPAMIWRGSQQCFADSEVNLIRAYIKPDNQISIRAFIKAGFTDDGTAELAGTTVRQFVMERDCSL